ncbi:MAG: hypothetical protein LBO08_03630 [Rickettsiales bacterium]|jgi:phage repressor protein C with HTH and peptisase S24 domain|nr:hypothetical protein [Rickettsiales bacterium]
MDRVVNHAMIWNALERFAKENNMSCSGLAKKSGLDATIFNRSKRWTVDGKERWPNTQSIAKVLAATNSNAIDFIKYLTVLPKAA